MSQDLRGSVAAIALCIGVVTATAITAISETGNFPLDKEVEANVSSSPSASPSKSEGSGIPVQKPSPSVTSSPSPSLSSLLVRKPSSSPTPKEFAKEKVGFRQFSCLDSLWKNESEWKHDAVNSSSGAYGIPQALPASKMESAGKDWKSNPFTQVKWGVAYIEERYKTPCAAWAFFQRNNWY